MSSGKQEQPSSNQLDELKREVARNPRSAIAHYNLGVGYNLAGQHQEAVRAYGSAIELGPDYAAAHYNLGSTLADLGLLDEAGTQFDHVIRLAPQMPQGYSCVVQSLERWATTRA